MTPQSRMWEIALLPTPPRWNSEQELLLIDSARNHRYWKLQFPPTFGPGNAVWPLPIFMHAAGGGSLLDFAKKHFSSPGLEFTMKNFIIASPRCVGKWTELPQPWILELVRQLRACSWVDVERIYLTGVSMGGMGALEVSAAATEHFEGVAAVAASHRSGRDHLVEKLWQTPALLVHSSSDTTCKISVAEAHRKALRNKGHERMEVFYAPNVDHCNMGTSCPVRCRLETPTHWERCVSLDGISAQSKAGQSNSQASAEGQCIAMGSTQSHILHRSVGIRPG